MDLDLRFDGQFDIKEHDLKWWNAPNSWYFDDSGLVVNMNAKQDFWRKTYYKPLLIKNNGHLLYKEFDMQEKLMLETHFKLNAKTQFDQGGIMVYFDEEHWIKTGIEEADGANRLSCVVTNGFSDWSTQVYASDELLIRVYKLGVDFVVEAKDIDKESWSFIRICHLNCKEDTNMFRFGLYACAPTDTGGSVQFSYARYKQVDSFHHTS